MKTTPFIGSPRGNQQGAALLVVLIVLLILTLLGIVSLRVGIMQERMAANIATRSMSFQVAEAGLRQAELIARDGTPTFPAAGCAAGRCAKASGWESVGNFWNDGQAGYQTGDEVPIGETASGETTSLRPRYIIEDFGKTSVLGATNSCIDMSKPCINSTSQNVYRITSYAKTPNGAEVVLQSLYRR